MWLISVLLLTWSLIRHYGSWANEESTGSRLPLLMLAICPINIMVAGFHANTDPLMVLFLLAAVWSLEVRHSVLLCGCCIGMAMNIKIIPLLLLPVLLFYMKHWGERALCLTAALVTVLCLLFRASWTTLPLLLECARVQQYERTLGNQRDPETPAPAWITTFTHCGKFGVAALVLMAYSRIGCNRSRAL